MNLNKNLGGVNSKWITGNGPEADIVISCRIRLARNIKGISFPLFFKDNEHLKVIQGVKEAIENSELVNKIGAMDYIYMNELLPIERQVLVEKHLVSPQFVDKCQYSGLAVSLDEVISIMVNEEDHLRIQCILPGLQLIEAWEKASQLDDLLEDRLEFLFSEKLGYLTSCPTNVGTGIRASVMLHLPGLVLTNQINRVINTISQIGLTVRGLYGEGTEAVGNLFQISNQITLGQTEIEIINKILAVTKELIDQERSARTILYNEIKDQIEDRVYRALGILKYARIITSDETMQLISDVRLGLDLGVIKNITSQVLNELIVISRVAYIQKYLDKVLNPIERDIARAKIIREKLKLDEKIS